MKISDFIDRVKTSHPGAYRQQERRGSDSYHSFLLHGTFITLRVPDEGKPHVTSTAGDKPCESLEEAHAFILDALNAAWRAAEKPRTTLGAGSTVGGGGDDEDSSPGEPIFLEPEPDDD